MSSIHQESLPGFNRELETLRQEQFERFQTSECKEMQRLALRGLAELTSKRSPEFIAAMDKARGIWRQRDE